MVNGRCPGCDYINPEETLYAWIVPFRVQTLHFPGQGNLILNHVDETILSQLVLQFRLFVIYLH